MLPLVMGVADIGLHRRERAAPVGVSHSIGFRRAAVVPVPIYFDGSDATLWSLDMTPAQCRRHLG